MINGPARLAVGFVVPRVTASALLGQGLRWALARPLASCFCQGVYGAAVAAAGWGRLQQQRPHRHVFIRRKQVYKGSSAMPHLTS